MLTQSTPIPTIREKNTIIINKEAYMALRNLQRGRCGLAPLTHIQTEVLWNNLQAFRNGGADPATHPIAEDEVRISGDSFDLPWGLVTHILLNNGFTYRDDGFTYKSIDI